MPRIAGIDIPRDKQIWVSLQYIHGIGETVSRQLLTRTGIAAETKADDLTDAEVSSIREIIDHELRVEGDLRREKSLNIKRLTEIGSYRGSRHRHNLPVHGQRTRTNARTLRGAKKTVAGRGKKRGTTKK
jgi:small subunit ribosomal protein S13